MEQIQENTTAHEILKYAKSNYYCLGHNARAFVILTISQIPALKTSELCYGLDVLPLNCSTHT